MSVQVPKESRPTAYCSIKVDPNDSELLLVAHLYSDGLLKSPKVPWDWRGRWTTEVRAEPCLNNFLVSQNINIVDNSIDFFHKNKNLYIIIHYTPLSRPRLTVSYIKLFCYEKIYAVATNIGTTIKIRMALSMPHRI